MDTDATRRYRLPTHLSMKLPQYRQYFNPPSLAAPLRDIPDPHDLFNIKEDLENIASEPEARAHRLQRDLAYLLEKVKVVETPPEHKSRPVTGGKNMEVVIERMRKQQQQQQQATCDLYESGSTTAANGSLRHNASRISKSQLERQAALEALKRRRRRDDSEESYEGIVPTTRSRRSDSPPPDVIQNAKKRKSMDDTTTTTQHNGKRRHLHHHQPHPPPTPPLSADHVKKQKNTNASDEELDFVRVKPNQQVPILTFWAAMEPYFRPLTEDDRKYLMYRDEEHEDAFDVPPLGKHYRDQWAEEERIATEMASRRSSQRQEDRPSEGLLERLMSSLIPEHEDEADDNDAERVSEGQERMNDEYDDDDDDDDDEDDEEDDDEDDEDEDHDDDAFDEDEDPDAVISHYRHIDTPIFEDRLRQEMQYVGLLSDDVDEHNWNARQDDPISAEIRRLSRELNEQITTNDFRKNRLLQVVDTQLQYDQYRQVLDALEMQVEQSYMKRFRVQKAKKRKSGSSTKSALSENTLAAMEKRSMFINELGPLFADKNLVLPSKSIYE